MAEEDSFLNLRGLQTFKDNLDNTYMKAESAALDSATNGYWLIKQYTVIPSYDNFRDVFAVCSRHGGCGLYCVSCGNNSATLSKANSYGSIEYLGITGGTDGLGAGSIFTNGSTSFMLYLSNDFKTFSLFCKNYDYNATKIVCLSKSLYRTSRISPSAIMTSIPADKYGTAFAYTSSGISDSYINSLFTS